MSIKVAIVFTDTSGKNMQMQTADIPMGGGYILQLPLGGGVVREICFMCDGGVSREDFVRELLDGSPRALKELGEAIKAQL